jgi:dTDP-4-dehydrorhamnose reductase
VRLLVAGASGFTGRHVCRTAVAAGAAVVGTFHRQSADIPGVEWRPLDVTDADATQRLVADVSPDAVINAVYAPATSLDPSAPPELNWTTNAVGAVHVALACARAGARLVHISSDAIFSGRPEPFREDDAPSPVYPYGAAKAAAEVGVAAALPDVTIVRPSLICGEPDGEMANREKFVLDLAAGRRDGVLFTDDVRSPVAVTDLATALVELATNGYRGRLHIGGPDAMSFYELGVLIAIRYGADPARLTAATIASAGTTRPGHVVLDCALASSVLGTRIRGVREFFALPNGDLGRV